MIKPVRLLSCASILTGALFFGPLDAGAQHRSHKGDSANEQSRFGPDSLRPMPNFGRAIDSEVVRDYWLRMMPQVNPPSQMSSGYQYAMPFYRKELAEKNCLVDDINRGTYDERAECEALRHNIRHYRRHGDQGKADKLQAILIRREALASGDSKALNSLLLAKLLESDSESPRQLQDVVTFQANRIAELEQELEALKTRLIRLEISTAPSRTQK